MHNQKKQPKKKLLFLKWEFLKWNLSFNMKRNSQIQHSYNFNFRKNEI